MPVSLRLASSPDIPLIARLADRIWRVHYASIISADQIEYMLKMMYSEENLAKQMEEGYFFFLVEADGRTIGYISIGKKSEGEYFLSKFYMEIAEQGKGYGKEAFAALVNYFPDLKTMRLQVNRKNFKSVNFYFRVGFVIEDSKDFDLGGGYSMDDFVMVFVRR